jgi:pimeloyl-ACP methyl ester carboxylesterase
VQVFLVHGMGRSPFGLLPTGRYLRQIGHTTSFFGYSVALHSFEENAARLLTHVKKNAAPEGYSIVAHSLGGVMTRYISPDLPERFRKFVMLGTPNRPAIMAQKFASNPIYLGLTGTSGQHLGDREFYRRLTVPAVPSLVIAGNLGRGDRLSPFAGAPNDGIVSVEETRLDGAEHVEVRAVHTWIMNDPLARLILREFLERDR